MHISFGLKRLGVSGPLFFVAKNLGGYGLI
jgi:hypothetical protein